MLCKEVMDAIEAVYPKDYALEWDNVGLLAGRDDKEVKRIYVALDATDEVINAAVKDKADMLVTHHPMIFSGMRSVNNLDFIGARIIKLIQNDISYYAMHTNYDVLGMGELSGKKLQLINTEVLEVTCDGEVPEGIGRVADLEREITLEECCSKVKKGFDLGAVQVFGDLDRPVKRIAISPGSGKSMIKAALNAMADVLITGDIDHHTGIDAAALGLSVIDAGHYGLEYIFVEDVKNYLEGNLKDVTVTAAPVCHPFNIV